MTFLLAFGLGLILAFFGGQGVRLLVAGDRDLQLFLIPSIIVGLLFFVAHFVVVTAPFLGVAGFGAGLGLVVASKVKGIWG